MKLKQYGRRVEKPVICELDGSFRIAKWSEVSGAYRGTR